MKTALFDYTYPEELVAQEPAAVRDGSRLMVVDPLGSLHHRRFAELPDLLLPGDCLVINETRVIPARLLGVKPTGGAVELLLLRRLERDTWEAMAKPARRLKVGATATFGEGRLAAEVVGELPGGRRQVRLSAAGDSVDAVMEEVGVTPLPPYIHNDPKDPSRYQTVYAREGVSAAAPTAGLHFTEGLLDRISAMGVGVAAVRLDVGLGTFRPIETDDIEDHVMHSERFSIGDECARAVNEARNKGGRVIAVGTTSARVLESVAAADGRVTAGSGETDLYIQPGYDFRVVDALVTNFHLPRSSLLVMVSAFAGTDTVSRAYAEAIEKRYRLFSFGDAMFFWKAE